MWHGLFFKVLLLSLVMAAGVETLQAQELHQDLKETVSAEVLEVVSAESEEIAGTDTTRVVQTVRVLLKNGARAGEVATVTNEVVTLAPGDDIFLHRIVTVEGDEYLTYADFERRPTLALLTIVFVGLLLIVARAQGARALMSLVVSLLAIMGILVPALLAGYHPASTTVLVAAVIMAVALFGTHGCNARSVIAFLGTMGAVLLTCVVASLATTTMRLTGFSDDASVYLNFATNGSLDLSGLLLGGIIVGILGVLDDVAVTQVSVVAQLKVAHSVATARTLYHEAMVVGRDHIGSIVNTLALAYVGVSLPLILLYAKAETNIWLVLNQEVVAAELLRIIVGSIGLVLAVPATTAVAAWYFSTHEVDTRKESFHSHQHHH